MSADRRASRRVFTWGENHKRWRTCFFSVALYPWNEGEVAFAFDDELASSILNLDDVETAWYLSDRVELAARIHGFL